MTPDQVAQWAAQWFTRENAALWVTGEHLPELYLPLPAGTTRGSRL